MKNIYNSLAALLFAATVLTTGITYAQETQPQSLAALLESGIYQEDTVGDLNAAARIYQQVLDAAQSNRPYAAQAAYRLGALQLKQKKTQDAIATFTKLKTDYPDQKDLIAQADAQLSQAGIITKTSVSPADKRAANDLAKQAWQLWSQRKLPEAEDLFQQAIDKDPANANTWNGLGWAQMNQGNKNDARTSFEKAVSLDPRAAASWNGLGWIAKGEGKTDDAITDWQKAYDVMPNTTAAISGLASTYSETGDYDNAILWYNRWIKADPQSIDAKSGLEAATTIKAAAQEAVKSSKTWLNLLDDGKYGESWDDGYTILQEALSRNQWERAVRIAREPFGKFIARKLSSALYKTELPGAPDGKYVLIQYQTEFENKKSAVETITLALSSDEKWQVAGYYIK